MTRLSAKHSETSGLDDCTLPPSVLPPARASEISSDWGKKRPASLLTKRGRWSWTDIFGFYLPRYDGPHSVGTITLEVPMPEAFATRSLNSPLTLVNPPHEPALKVTNSLITIFYPTAASSAGGPRPKWISLSQIKGYLKFANIEGWKRALVFPMAFLLLRSVRLPVTGAAPIIEQSAKRRLVLFCHGLTGNRTCYSQLCGQLASRGYVVAAIEHRDGSGSHSVVNSIYKGVQSSSEVAYIDMSDLTDETRPPNYLIARAHQLELRSIELLAASDLLAQFSMPGGWKSIKSSQVRLRGSADWSGDDGMAWDDTQWERFSSAVEWNENVVVAGHSFGAGTVVASARLPERPKYWEKFILYDPWLETLNYWPEGAVPLEDESSIKFPSLVVNSPGFSKWTSHFDPLMRFVQGTRQSWLVTIGGIIHSSFSDLLD